MPKKNKVEFNRDVRIRAIREMKREKKVESYGNAWYSKRFQIDHWNEHNPAPMMRHANVILMRFEAAYLLLHLAVKPRTGEGVAAFCRFAATLDMCGAALKEAMLPDREGYKEAIEVWEKWPRDGQLFGFDVLPGIGGDCGRNAAAATAETVSGMIACAAANLGIEETIRGLVIDPPEARAVQWRNKGLDSLKNLVGDIAPNDLLRKCMAIQMRVVHEMRGLESRLLQSPASPKKEFTKTERKVLAAFEGNPRTVTNIATKLGMDKGQVSRACTSLCRKKCLMENPRGGYARVVDEKIVNTINKK